jgi:nucleoside permease NupC
VDLPFILDMRRLDLNGMIEQFFDLEGIVKFIAISIILAILLLILTQFQKNVVGQSSEAANVLESTKDAISLLFSGFLSIDDIKGTLAIIGVLTVIVTVSVHIYREYIDDSS